jgi:hypothetical protein
MRRAVVEDPITGLLNVRAFYAELADLRPPRQPFTILLADIRGMRALNERYGHPTGTEAMRALAHVLRASAGTEVLACRLGSDEVAVALIGDEQRRSREVIDGSSGGSATSRWSCPTGSASRSTPPTARPLPGGRRGRGRGAARRRPRQGAAKAAGLDKVGTADGDVA